MRILFGHQSVGADVLLGLQEIDDSVTPAVALEATGPLPVSGELLAHFRVGTNGQPHSKIDHFVSCVRERRSEQIDIALFKFCYVDIIDDASARLLVGEYCSRMDELQAESARPIIAHVTVPLRARPRGLGSLFRATLGKPSKELARNAARHDFNEALRQRYVDTGLLFDLAAAEADRGPQGRSGKRPPSLHPDYTNDGGHLNRIGRAAVSGEFARFLTRLRRRVA